MGFTIGERVTRETKFILGELNGQPVELQVEPAKHVKLNEQQTTEGLKAKTFKTADTVLEKMAIK
ncbi:MAG: hypothetical protein J0L55_14905 [Caulobacterales bacterium]|nr:hypothetical protein [Caulobacterales bacterium]